MSEIVWRPSQQQIQKTQLTKFCQFVAQRYGKTFADYQQLHAWSVVEKTEFWAAIWEFCGVTASRPYDTVLENPTAMPGARWFAGAKLNFAENLLRFCDDKIAIIAVDERGEQQRWSYAALHAEVASVAQALEAMGVTTGDRVAAYLPNIGEAVIAMLATTSLGAVWTACSPDFGVDAVVDRFYQIQPKVLFASASQQYRGTSHSLIEKTQAICRKITSIEQVILVPYLNPPPSYPNHWHDYRQLSHQTATLSFKPLPFEHPVYVLYSSGTTGKPKCIVHGAGGTLLQHLKELRLHTDLQREETIFYFTTCSWMMWHWLVSSLAVGATLVLYDGAPDFPQTDRLLGLIDTLEITVFGTSAKYLSALQKAGIQAGTSHQLQRLRCILSTGSPLLPAQYDYVYQTWKPDVMLCSISGGSDIISCFALGNPTLPIYRGELQCRGLGMDVDIFDECGQAVRRKKGELVCKSPFPAMPIYFWNDPKDKKYHAAYFKAFANTWAQGDYAEITAHDGVIIYGRSDTTLNPGGVRIGTAEIYRQVESLEAVVESVAIGQRWQKDIRIILFVKLQPNLILTEKHCDDIRSKIRNNLSPRHLPSKILQVQDIPKTINGKIVELAIQQIIHGEPIQNRSSIANPQALPAYEKLATQLSSEAMPLRKSF